MPFTLTPHLGNIAALCRRFRVMRLEIFGSAVLAEQFEPAHSDLDFLVSFPVDYDFGPWMSRVQELEEQLATLLGRKVQLVLDSALRNPWFRREAEKTRRLI